MKEVKFRAWIKCEKRMADVVGLRYESDGKIRIEVLLPGKTIEDVNNKSNIVFWYKDEEAVLLQYIGHKDLNSNEIYENDIVKLRDHEFIAGFKRGFNYSKGLIIGNIYTKEE